MLICHPEYSTILAPFFEKQSITMSPQFQEVFRKSPPHGQAHFQLMYDTIKKSCPEATEVLAYGMPAFRLKTNLCYFACHKSHIGFYPTGAGIEAFKEKIPPYSWSKGAIQFPYNLPLPTTLIAEIVEFRASHCR
jgi:uncharacterized protein YdhG (YjbR/CyaY superfamily)